VLGYDPARELDDRNERRKLGLPPVVRMPKIDDAAEYRNSYLGRDSDWIRFATTVSTSADQVALAPGYLEREWTEGGRRYFRYTMDAPILHFYSYLSARWAVARDRWTGEGAPPGGVAIEIYHHPAHDRNVARMIDGVKKSLDYFTAHFSPYQHRQVRIVEFPRYARFAQSFPNTIPFSESIGFIADLRDPETIDYVFYVTAHEVAHQWWAHQVIGANVQGATVLSETLSQYSALMVMEKEYGRDMMRRFLKYELDRYLRDRGGELVEELPLHLVENQGYIHYRKGSVVMYALRDAIGEEAVNRALRKLIAAEAFQGAPFPTTRDLLAAIRAETPPEQQALVTDLFERITLFENRAVAAEAHRRADGKWVVDLTLAAKKVYADGEGRETPAPLDAWLDVGVFGPEPEDKGEPAPVLYLEKHRFTAAETKLQVVVDSRPAEAGVDPFNKLVDRNSDDNRRQVRIGG
jgi:aminopeptidase N